MNTLHTLSAGPSVTGSVMKTLSLIVGAAVLAITPAAASAQQSITVGGNAAAICSLPDTWQTRTTVGGAFGSFVGTTWTIPSSAFSATTGQPVITSELGLRITGPAYCNTPHRIVLSSLKGAMANDSVTTAPTGFAVSRQVKYDAHWADDNLTAQARIVGPGIQDWIPTGPGASTSAQWTGAIPGSSYFDIRLSVRRGDGSPEVPLVAGAYSDTVTVTLTPNS